MSQENRSGADGNPEKLGTSFQQASSPSFSGDLGPSFEDRNKSPKERPGRKWLWIGLVLLLALVLVLVHHFSGDASSKKGSAAAGASGSTGSASGHGRGQQGPASITVAQSKVGDINVYVEALGTVTPTYTVTLYSQITGQIQAVHYTEGQLVHKGQPLVDIDPRPYEATLQQAEGTLKHDTGVLDEAKMDLKRYQDALAKNAIARQQEEDQEKIVTQDEGTVQTDEGTVQADKVQLSYCHIVAPISGRVGLRLVDPGNTVFSGSSSTLVVITAVQPITVVFNVSEDDLSQVQAQLKVKKTLEVDAFDRDDVTKIEAGKLTSLDNQIDTTTGTVKFRASFANKNLDLFPNQFVNARLLLKTLNNAVLVPNAAVQHNGTAAFVYVVKPNPKDANGSVVSVQNVTTSTNDDQVTAVTGLPAGVTVATSGFDRLENGASARVAQGGKNGGQGQKGSTTTTVPGSPATPSSTTNGGGNASR
jgi:multidrug efflux system membrane fusion protein